jgi:hypothetical protein
MRLADQTRRSDAIALVKLMKSATGEKPTMWGPSIIGFGRYHYRYEGGREGDMSLVGFSLFSGGIKGQQFRRLCIQRKPPSARTRYPLYMRF